MAFLPYDREIEGEGRGCPRTTPTRMPRNASSRCSPTSTAVPTSRSCTPLATTSRRGGHHGEHGSLDVVQSRAPLVLSGAGVRRRGFVDEHARLVDVGPTLAHLAGSRTRTWWTARASRSTEACSRHTCITRRQGGHAGSWASSGTAHTAATCCTSSSRGSCRGWPAWSSTGWPCAEGGGAAPSVTLTNHPRSSRGGTGPARRPRQRLLRPCHGRAGRAERRDDVAPQREWLHGGARTVFEMVNDHVAPARPRGPPASTRPSTEGPTTRPCRSSAPAATAGVPGDWATSSPTPTPRRSSATPSTSTTATSGGGCRSTTSASSRCSSSGPIPPLRRS